MNVKITVMKIARYDDLIDKYEIPQADACNMREGRVFVSEHGEMPEGFCENAWETVAPFVKALASGGGKFYGDWMKNERSAMISCNDGFRPVSFLAETTE